MEGKVIISREEYEGSLGDFIEKEKLQKRIDKAIEYIEEYQRKIWLDKKIYIEDYDDLINILKGEENNDK